jgi:hypothetical protein
MNWLGRQYKWTPKAWEIVLIVYIVILVCLGGVSLVYTGNAW